MSRWPRWIWAVLAAAAAPFFVVLAGPLVVKLIEHSYLPPVKVDVKSVPPITVLPSTPPAPPRAPETQKPVEYVGQIERVRPDGGKITWFPNARLWHITVPYDRKIERAHVYEDNQLLWTLQITGEMNGNIFTGQTKRLAGAGYRPDDIRVEFLSEKFSITLRWHDPENNTQGMGELWPCSDTSSLSSMKKCAKWIERPKPKSPWEGDAALDDLPDAPQPPRRSWIPRY